jgi:glutamate N-acetyltransferase/amino-acid N-acetyltransferase
MSPTFLPDGSITSPGGVRVTGIHSGLKATRDRDLGLLVFKTPCVAAAHLGANSGTTGAWTTANLRRNPDDVRVILVLSGANGGRGAEAVAACDALAEMLADEAWLKPHNVLLLGASDGETALDLDLLRRAVPRALDELDSNGGRRLALALAMPDQTPRMAALEVTFAGDKKVLLGGLATAGPLARYLVTTNAAISSKLLKTALDHVLDKYPDLDQGSLVLLANGLADAPPCKRANDAQFKAWLAGLLALVAHLQTDQAGLRA